MKRITGIGGVFFKAENPDTLFAWYEKHLGLTGKPGEGFMLPWPKADDPNPAGISVFSIFPKSTKYFGPGQSTFMVNFTVENLNALLETLQAEGVEIDPKRESYDFGKFAWIIDPEGNRIELWEPPASEK